MVTATLSERHLTIAKTMPEPEAFVLMVMACTTVSVFWIVKAKGPSVPVAFWLMLMAVELWTVSLLATVRNERPAPYSFSRMK